jgi:hypothetical protein
MSTEYNAQTIVKLVEKKKVPLLVRHAVVAVWDGSRRVLKKTKTGKVFRTSQRKKVSSRPVSRDKKGFIDAFNIIASQFATYGHVRPTLESITLTGKGRKQNSLHLRETDSRRRTMAFMRVYKKLFKEEIKTYNESINQG